MTRKTPQKTIKLAKADVRYWLERIAFQTPASRTYSVQIQHQGERRWLGLATDNRADAAILARKLYHDVKANGWQAVLAQRRGALMEKKVNVTVGEYVEAVRTKSLLSAQTLESYAQALCKIAGDIAQVEGRERRNAIRLRTLSHEKIEAWRVDYIRRKATDPLREKSARISANSLLLRARALFLPETASPIRDLVELPEPKPFAGVKVESMHAPRHRATLISSRYSKVREKS